ncbi:MAG: flagellar motor switch protein FliM [Thermacetogeniaceae bacterium]
MADILSQAEIDALLAALTSGEINPNELKEEEKSKRVRTYDFRRPNKFSKEQINSMHVIYENYARTLATFLSAQLRTIVQVSVLSLEQLTYDEFIRSLPDPSIIVIFNMDPLEGNGIFEIQPPIAFGMIDRLFGGSGSAISRVRPLTEIERAIIERVSQRMLNIMGEAWENIVKLNPKVEFIESNPQFAQIVSPMEMVLLISLEAKIGEIEGMINFCLPYIVLEPVIDKLSLHLWFARTSNEQNPAYRLSIQKRIESAKVPLHVLLGTTTITVRELLDLQVGDVVTLDRKVNEDLDVMIGNSSKFRGKPGILNKKLAVQITGFHQEKGGDLA